MEFEKDNSVHKHIISERFSRSEIILGAEKMMILKKSRVLIFGAGGVGGAVIEGLTRSGIGRIGIVDNDVITESNINRQIIALYSTLGQSKAKTAGLRIKDINPDCNVDIYNTFATPQNINDNEFNLIECDYVVDAIDNVTAKLALAVFCEKNGIKLISSMGTGNKLNPLLFRICDIYETSVCPLARVMRYELKKRGVKSLKVLFSEEKPIMNKNKEDTENIRVPGSISFVPPTAGFIIAGEVVRELVFKAKL